MSFRYYFLPAKDKSLYRYIRNVFGVSPKNLSIYKQAFRHKSLFEDPSMNNERMEYLGDAILGAIIAEFLFLKFPLKSEGFLTELRSRMVNRVFMNNLALKLGIKDHLHMANDPSLKKGGIYGNCFEALMGALYLDLGFTKVSKIIQNRILKYYVDLDEIEQKDTNFKSRLLEWAQRERKNLVYEVLSDPTKETNYQYKIRVLINDVEMGIGFGGSKKIAEQDAAGKAIEKLEI